MTTKAELLRIYEQKRAALEHDRKLIAAGEPAPENFQELVDLVEAARLDWERAT